MIILTLLEILKNKNWFDSSRLKLSNYICFYSALYVVDIISSVSKELTPTCRAFGIPLASFQNDVGVASGTCKIRQMAESIFIAHASRRRAYSFINQDRQFLFYSSAIFSAFLLLLYTIFMTYARALIFIGFTYRVIHRRALRHPVIYVEPFWCKRAAKHREGARIFAGISIALL